jgi:hypothetical protein
MALNITISIGHDLHDKYQQSIYAGYYNQYMLVTWPSNSKAEIYLNKTLCLLPTLLLSTDVNKPQKDPESSNSHIRIKTS